jgi:hypothetical protein
VAKNTKNETDGRNQHKEEKYGEKAQDDRKNKKQKNKTTKLGKTEKMK